MTNKRINFESAKKSCIDEKIEATLNAEFQLPDSVDTAMRKSFEQIKTKSASASFKPRKKRKMNVAFKALTGIAASAAVFSAVCITNPAWASNIPVVGSVFEKIGNSLGFSGDFAEFAKPLEDDSTGSGNENETGDGAVVGKDTKYSKTVDGVTVALSEVYCNDEALYLSMTVKSDEPIPDTMVSQDDTPVIALSDAELKLSYNKDCKLYNAYLDGKMLDKYTYAGVLRVDMNETTTNDEEMQRYYDDRNAFLKEKGIDVEADDFSFESAVQQLGIEDFTDAQIASIGGPNQDDYNLELEVPEKFSADLIIGGIRGDKPQEQNTTPEMPKELKDEYTNAMAEYGLNEADYESFTDEEKDIEHKLFTDMWNKYYELYPETKDMSNLHNSWTLEGGWEFNFDVEKNHSETVTKEVNVLDEDGDGIVSVTKTPFEITLNMNDPEFKYCAAMFDADGELMGYGKFSGSTDTYAVQDRDVSKVSIYLCDYIQYMDELKGYYWSDDYEENKKTKTFQELLHENALLEAEVNFED